jgi:2-polyprenyl-3-methyl-5-hydroxy-6-metoxy-1,4-benzoquinol methylase
MKQEIVKKLIQLNQDFYRIIAAPFTKTRSYSWAGWEQLYLLFQQWGFNPTSVLDLGCGNGRFLSFARSKWLLADYLGIDGSKELLDFAKATYAAQTNTSFIEQDLITDIDLTQIRRQFDLVVILGVMHHVPSQELRVQFLQAAAAKLNADSYLVVTFWDFLSEKQLAKKIVPWSKVGLTTAAVDEHDYLLDWQREKLAYRYCHYYTKEEIAELAEFAGLEIVQEFLADGPGGKANRYVVFKRH